MKNFRVNRGLDTINAQDAYAKGVTGKGVTIGFVDTGLDARHAEFAGKSIKLNDRSGLETANAAQLRHGTGVASIALGAHGSGMHGVAFDADPAMWSLNLDGGYLDVNDRILSRGLSALMFGFRRRKLSMHLGQPGYFESGSLNLNVPYQRMAGGGVRFHEKKISLSADQRPVEMRLLYGDEAGRFGLRVQKHANTPTDFNFGYVGRF